MEAPLPILALKLIALGARFGKAVKVALGELLSMNDGRDGLFKAGTAQ
jgi:hypothetical protein